MRILGIDPGYATVGYGILDWDGKHFKLVGYGAIIIGDVEIADNCVIGAGAVVTKSFTKKGSVIAGVPAREIQ